MGRSEGTHQDRCHTHQSHNDTRTHPRVGTWEYVSQKSSTVPSDAMLYNESAHLRSNLRSRSRSSHRVHLCRTMQRQK